LERIVMRLHAFCFALLSATAIVASAPAQAQNGSLTRSFVSSSGADSNPCTITQPCASFAQAYTKVGANGIIAALDPGKYGPIAITGPVTINGNGWAAITAPAAGNGITINAGSGNVILTGLEVDGAGAAYNGIQFNSGASLTVENCVVRNVTKYGLAFFGSATTLQTLTVSNSYFNNNSTGIAIAPSSSGAVTASIDRTVFSENAGNGLFVQGLLSTGPISVAVTDSVAANGISGFLVESSPGHSVTDVSLTHSVVIGNTNYGVQSLGTNATIWLAQSTLTGNGSAGGSGYQTQSGGVIMSYGDNYLAAANGPSTDSSLTGVSRQ
jgi:hypothetical protein